MNRIKPAALIEDTRTGELIVVSPGSWQVQEALARVGITCTTH